MVARTRWISAGSPHSPCSGPQTCQEARALKEDGKDPVDANRDRQPNSLISTTSIDDGNPHHVAFNYDRGNYGANALFIDGTQEASGNSSGSCVTGSGPVDVRADAAPSFWTTPAADIWEISHWGGVNLSTGEVSALAKGYTAQRFRLGNLRMYAPLVRDEHDIRSGFTTSVTGTTVVPQGVLSGARSSETQPAPLPLSLRQPR